MARQRLVNSLLMAVALVGMSTVGRAQALDAPPGWLTYSGPLDDVAIIFVSSPGSGEFASPDSLVLAGSGLGTRIRTTMWLRGNPAPRRSTQEVTFSREAFVSLVNRFYADRFFQLGDEYYSCASLRLDEGGLARAIEWSVPGGATDELVVRLGSYEKHVRFKPQPECCPANILGLMQAVKDFMRGLGLY